MGNVELLKEYILQETWISDIPLLSHKLVIAVIDGLSQDFIWLINLLAANTAYFARNIGEVWVYLLLASLFSGIMHFFFQTALVVGKHRYVMEQRFQKRTLLRRALAPYHGKYLLHIVWVMFRTNIQLLFWWLTVIGGIYKTYQYRMIPYLLAENPAISFQEAMTLSKTMTKNCKWKMFALDISLWYLWLLKLIPLVGLLIAVPYETAVNAEVYFFLRRLYCTADNQPFFCERAFDAPAYWESSPQEEAQVFLLEDIVSGKDDDSRFAYHATDLILLFFLFSLAGWLWEVTLHMVQYHEFMNRGTLYGPWLPIYGTGGVLCILLFDRCKKNFPKTFLLIMLVSGILEFMTSWVLDFFLNMSYWDHAGWFANLNGRVCLAGLFAFAVGGSLSIYIVGPYIKKKLAAISPAVRYGVCTVLCVLFAVDLICCMIFGLNSVAGVEIVY